MCRLLMQAIQSSLIYARLTSCQLDASGNWMHLEDATTSIHDRGHLPADARGGSDTRIDCNHVFGTQLLEALAAADV